MHIIRLEPLNSIHLNENSTEKEIEKILIGTPNDMQMHVLIPYKDNNPEATHKTALIQRVPGSKNHFYVCFLVLFGETKWEKKPVKEIADWIYNNLSDPQTREIEIFRLLTRAIEGKSISECGRSAPDRANN